MRALYAAIDLHSNNNVTAVTDESDRTLYCKRLKNELARVLEALGTFPPSEVRGVVVESTYNWYWLVDGLMAQGYRVHLANTGAIQQYAGLKYSDDESDARWLAKLLRLGILPEGYIYPKAQRAVRDLLRKRAHLVRQRTSNVLSIQNLLARNTGRRLSGHGAQNLGEAEVDEMLSDPNLGLAVKSSVAVVRCLNEQIRELERTVLAQVEGHEEYRGLLTVPGVGRVLGLTIRLEVGTIARFASEGDFCSYARCVGGGRLSNGKKKGAANTKNGNAYLGWAFMEAAQFASRFDEGIGRYYQGLRAHKHPVVARKIVAHKLAQACYYILRDQTSFDAHKAFGA